MNPALNSLRTLSGANSFIYRVSGPEKGPVLIYLPGVHGDWTSFSLAREALAHTMRVVEVAYPRRERWDAQSFARALADLYRELGLARAHLLAESFGSVPGWAFALSNPSLVCSLILVGGFTRPPYAHLAQIAAAVLRMIPTRCFEAGVDAYLRYAYRGGWKRPPPEEGVPPFPAVRTELGRKALCARLALIQKTDFTPGLVRAAFPVCYLGGGRDRIVPVRREIRTLKILLPPENRFEPIFLPHAGHILLVTHPRQCVREITRWVAATNNCC